MRQESNILVPSGRRQTYGLGTILNLQAWGKLVEPALDEAVSRIGAIDNAMSRFKCRSDIARINNSPGVFQTVGADTMDVMHKALLYAKRSGGAFDPTIGPLVKLWGIGTEQARIPDESEIRDMLRWVNYQDVAIDTARHAVRLTKPGQVLDLGGVAKGYAADQARDILRQHGIRTAMIDLGGNILAVGRKPDGSPWKVGIQNPLSQRGNILGVLEVEDRSVVTSAINEKFFLRSGNIYHHILDPRTGWPVANGLASVTIISEKSIDGDALSTAAFVLGLEQGLDLTESMGGIEAICVSANKDVHCTAGISSRFQLTDEDFTLK